MVLTMSDIGTNPKEVEESLARNFRIAKSWKAVLLIDEADVFVARRTVEDLERSSLVASTRHPGRATHSKPREYMLIHDRLLACA